MKPTKNKIYCEACQHSKMLFETKAKADNFILYNKEEIEEENGKAPVRSYYCRLCGGYHVTSKLSKKAGKWFDSQDKHLADAADELAKSLEDIEPAIMEVKEKIETVKIYIPQGRLNDAEMLLEECQKQMAPFRFCDGKKKRMWSQQIQIFNTLLVKINGIRELRDEKPEECEALFSKEDKTNEEIEICQAIQNQKILSTVNELLEEVDIDLQNKNIEAKEKIKKCRSTLKELACPFKKQLLNEIKPKIKEREVKAIVMFGSDTPKKKERKFIIRNQYDYRYAVLYIIGKLEKLKDVYESGDKEECNNILDIIAAGLDELPENEDTDILKYHYNLWCSKI